jgi:arabinose-5-phosphate isomerase
LGGRRLLYVKDVMRIGAALPTVRADATLADALREVTSKGLGMTAIVDDSMHVLGVFTDGDLRRALDRSADLRTTRMDQVMTAGPKSVQPSTLAAEAVHLMETHRITSLLVLDQDRKLAGLLHVHDLLRAGIF